MPSVLQTPTNTVTQTAEKGQTQPLTKSTDKTPTSKSSKAGTATQPGKLTHKVTQTPEVTLPPEATKRPTCTASMTVQTPSNTLTQEIFRTPSSTLTPDKFPNTNTMTAIPATPTKGHTPIPDLSKIPTNAITSKPAGTVTLAATETQAPTFTLKPTVTETPVPTFTAKPTIHAHKWMTKEKIIYHEEQGHYEDAFETAVINYYWSGTCANDSHYDEKSNRKYLDGSIVNTAGTVSEHYSLTPMGSVTPFYIIWNACGFWKDLDTDYDWTTRTTEGNNIILGFRADKLPDEWKAAASNYFGSTTTKTSLLLGSKEVIVNTGPKWVIDQNAYEEKIITVYCSECNAVKQN